MPGVEGERTSADDTRVGLLSYFQDSARAAWATHHEQHELEDKALALAVGGVKEAMALAVARVEQAQLALRELLEGQIESLRAARIAEHADLEHRILDHSNSVRESSTQRWASHHAEHALQEDSLHAWEDAHHREHELIQRAVDKASDALGVRLEGMNQFRAQLDRMVATLVTLDILDVRLAAISQRQDKSDEAMDKRLSALERGITRGEGRSSGYSAFWGYLVGGAGFLVAVIAIVHDFLPK